MSNFDSQWKRTEKELRQLYAELGFRFRPDEERLFYEFLDANEFGLAYEQLCDELQRTKKAISVAVYESIRTVGLRMHFEPAVWERLQSLVTNA